MSHWYDDNGKLVADANLRSARKEGLYGSVTTIIDILEKTGLNIWLRDQAILSALTFPRPGGVNDTELLSLIKADSKEQSTQAAEKGSLIHRLIERITRDEQVSLCEYEDDIVIIVEAVDRYLNDKIHYALVIEEGLTNQEYGFAGTPDLLAELNDEGIGLFDHKTQGTKEGERIKKYVEWSYQLAACNILTGRKADRFFNVVISTTEPGRIEEVEWKREEIDHAEQVFLTLVQLFHLIKKLPVIKRKVA
ncbi:MAG: hypothetical protein GY861_26900 [bacterium]|nr:hypothetical protein [bacterium]